MMEPAHKSGNGRFTKSDLEFTKIGLQGYLDGAAALCKHVCPYNTYWVRECEDCPICKVWHTINNQLTDIDEMLHWYKSNEDSTPRTESAL